MVFFEGLSLSILAIVAGIMILAGWVPQIIKGYKTKKLDDISKYSHHCVHSAWPLMPNGTSTVPGGLLSSPLGAPSALL